MHLLSRIVERYPWWMIGGVVLVTAVLALGIPHLTFSTDVQSFFAEDDPRLASFRRVSDTFGSSEYVLAVVSADSVFTVPVIRALDALTQELERVPGVVSVRSITNVANVKGTAWGIEVAPLMEALPASDEDAARLRERVLSSESIASRFVSADEQHTLILIQLGDVAERDADVADLREVVQRYAGDFRVRLTGLPVTAQELNALVRGTWPDSPFRWSSSSWRCSISASGRRRWCCCPWPASASA